MHDETDMEVEPRRREHVGRRGYSPRRTQSSSSNRVEMYFSEVDIDVRQPRPREPTVSLTNIRSSDDISSGYSSGEALQSTLASQGDSLVRTSSVGARTRAKTRPATKKTPEDAGEDSDNNDLSPSIKISFPSPLSHVTPEQALEILLLLSQNSNVADYIRFDHGPPVAGNNDLENTSQSGPTPEANETEVKESDTASPPDSAMMAEVQIIQSIESKPILEHLETTEVKQTVPKETETTETVDQSTTESSKDKEEPCTVLQEPMKVIDHTAITDELCQNKFDELKQLLSDAHKAVTNIVYTQEKLRSSDTNITECQNDEDAKKDDSEDSKATLKEGENENRDSLDDWTTSTVSRSNSDSRAGKYNKKPAPKAPLTESEEDLMETESQNALKATLVIKTGTLKTFSNTGTSKDVFIAHVSDLKSKSKKSKRQRTKEGFSKLLTIPKNIFHSAFNREQKGSPKMEDSESDVSAVPSRSNSLEPQETIVELVPKSRDAQSDDKSDNDTSNGSDQYVLASNDGSGEKNAGTSKDSETIVKEMSQSPRITNFATLPRSKKTIKKKVA